MSDTSAFVSSYEKALEVMCVIPSQLPVDPLSPSCHQFRLRPSEEAAILVNRFLNPPPPWGVKINLHRSFIGSEKCLQLGLKMILNQTVTFLDLSFCDLEEQAAEAFFMYLERNRTLKHLNVSGNNIKDSGACAAAKCVGNLETLHLASTEITDAGAIALADQVRESKTIKTLNIRNNHITMYGLYKLMDTLEPAFELMPSDIKELISLKEKEISTTSSQSPSKINDTSAEDYPLETITEEPISTNDQLPSGNSVSDAEKVGKQENEIDKEQREDEEVCEEEEKSYNESLHTLWVDYNSFFPEEVMKSLNCILAKRFPVPPPGAIKKKKGRKK